MTKTDLLNKTNIYDVLNTFINKSKTDFYRFDELRNHIPEITKDQIYAYFARRVYCTAWIIHNNRYTKIYGNKTIIANLLKNNLAYKNKPTSEGDVK